MSIFLLIASIVLWICAIATLPTRPTYSPLLSYCGLLCIGSCETNGYPWLPLNNHILFFWACITVVVILATMMQPAVIRNQSRGMAYIIGGAFVGLAIGLLGFTFSTNISMMYSVMVIAVIAGIFFGFLLYSRTPDGRPVGMGSGNFFIYLLAKGFPTAITIMLIGIVLVLLIAVNQPVI